MFYEGTEKRLFICINAVNLLGVDDSFWQQLVAHSGAEILSSSSNQHLKAYLLSESSLFIWQDKLLLITCGNTQLVKAALFIQQQFTKQQIRTLIFQRHQALKPHLQSSSFQQDTLLLEKQFSGHTQHWKEDYQGDLFCFGDLASQHITTQVIYMMTGLRGELADNLQHQSINKEVLLKKLKLTTFFDGLLIDHFSFDPKGYSLNAICGKDYLAIHLTPEQHSTYLSIETSFSTEKCTNFITYLQQLFLPVQMKTMHFATAEKQLNISVV